MKIEYNINDFAKNLRKEIEAQKENIAICVRGASERIVSDAKNNGNYQNRTGYLRSSIKATETIITSQGIETSVIAEAPYASFVEAKGYEVITGSAMNFDKYVKQEQRI